MVTYEPNKLEIVSGCVYQEHDHKATSRNLLGTTDNKISALHPMKSRGMTQTGHIACMEKMKNANIILVGRAIGKREFTWMHQSGPSRECEDCWWILPQV